MPLERALAKRFTSAGAKKRRFRFSRRKFPPKPQSSRSSTRHPNDHRQSHRQRRRHAETCISRWPENSSRPATDLGGEDSGDPIVALDAVSAGIGDRVLVVQEGFSAMTSVGRPNSPIDAAVIGVIDLVELV